MLVDLIGVMLNLNRINALLRWPSKEGKKTKFRQGNKVTVAATKDLIFPLKLLLKLEETNVNATPDYPLFLALMVA